VEAGNELKQKYSQSGVRMSGLAGSGGKDSEKTLLLSSDDEFQ